MKYKGDIIITDPCYIEHYKGQHGTPAEDTDSYRNDCIDIPTPSMMLRNTIYGDWSCHTFKGDDFKTSPRSDETVLGRFCADAGMVCVVPLKEVLDIDPDFLTRRRKHTYTLIKDFDGDVEFVIDKTTGTYVKDGVEKTYEDETLHIVGTGNIPFFTDQTGF